MRYNTYINNVKASEWDLNIQQAYLFAWMYELPSWADKVVIGDNIYWFASKTKAVKELPLLTDKTDTMYRYYKSLEQKKLILIKKIDGKDYISLTPKAKEWNQSEQSEINPTKLGNKSDINSEINPNDGSEINPTYNINKNINNISKVNNISKDNTKFSLKNFKSVLLDLEVDKEHLEDWLKARKLKKLANTKTALKRFINECNKHNYPVAKAVQDCAENGWAGFKYEWLKNNNNGKQKSNTKSQVNYSDDFKRKIAQKIQSG